MEKRHESEFDSEKINDTTNAKGKHTRARKAERQTTRHTRFGSDEKAEISNGVVVVVVVVVVALTVSLYPDDRCHRSVGCSVGRSFVHSASRVHKTLSICVSD